MPVAKKLYAPQEYYALERAAEYKSDFYKREIFAMAGGTIRHSLICGNIVREVGNTLRIVNRVPLQRNMWQSYTFLLVTIGFTNRPRSIAKAFSVQQTAPQINNHAVCASAGALFGGQRTMTSSGASKR